MNLIKRILGVFWLALAAYTAYFSYNLVQPKLEAGGNENMVFAIIVLFILTPLVVIGLGIFGYYAIKGEYDEEA